MDVVVGAIGETRMHRGRRSKATNGAIATNRAIESVGRDHSRVGATGGCSGRAAGGTGLPLGARGYEREEVVAGLPRLPDTDSQFEVDDIFPEAFEEEIKAVEACLVLLQGGLVAAQDHGRIDVAEQDGTFRDATSAGC